jgi:hypothetical protein
MIHAPFGSPTPNRPDTGASVAEMTEPASSNHSDDAHATPNPNPQGPHS